MPAPVMKIIRKNERIGVRDANESLSQLISQMIPRNAERKIIRLFVDALIITSKDNATITAAIDRRKVIGRADLSRWVQRVIPQTSVTITRNGDDKYSLAIKPIKREIIAQAPR